MTMTQKNETRWLCENARSLEKFPGQWVVFSVREGIVETGESLDKVLKGAKKCKNGARPFFFHVPSKEDMANSLL
jgi:hypothetical protein